ncbi:MAG TPA: hypothetical protein VFZ98_11665, partial [Vicinamibacterales bacterium]
ASALSNTHPGIMTFTIKKKITVNGKEYQSLDELPPDLKALYDKAMASGAGHATVTRIILNGRDVKGIGDMKPEMRAAVTDALGGGKSTTSPIVIVVAIAGALILVGLALLRLR